MGRHAHVGRGKVGLGGFANFANDPRLPGVPMILETPKGPDAAGRDGDQIKAETIRSLAGPETTGRNVAVVAAEEVLYPGLELALKSLVPALGRSRLRPALR